MKTKYLTIEQLKRIPVITVEQGRQFAADILAEQLELHNEMIGLYDNVKWKELSDRHYDLRQIRHAVLHLTGRMAIERKRASQR